MQCFSRYVSFRSIQSLRARQPSEPYLPLLLGSSARGYVHTQVRQPEARSLPLRVLGRLAGLSEVVARPRTGAPPGARCGLDRNISYYSDAVAVVISCPDLATFLDVNMCATCALRPFLDGSDSLGRNATNGCGRSVDRGKCTRIAQPTRARHCCLPPSSCGFSMIPQERILATMQVCECIRTS